jgi:lysozyme
MYWWLMVTGIDLSEKNGSIKWSQVGKGDIYFAFIKATEALDIVDSQFDANMKAAQESGILTGVYHWLHPGLHVGQQLDSFIKTVKSFRGLLPPVVCLQTNLPSLEEMEKNIKAFLALLEKKVGVKPIIYTSDAFWKTYLPKSSWGCDYPLWIDNPGTFWPEQLWPWAGWSFWQNSYQIRLPGIPLNLGSNWFNGTLDELRSMVIQ